MLLISAGLSLEFLILNSRLTMPLAMEISPKSKEVSSALINPTPAADFSSGRKDTPFAYHRPAATKTAKAKITIVCFISQMNKTDKKNKKRTLLRVRINREIKPAKKRAKSRP